MLRKLFSLFAVAGGILLAGQDDAAPGFTIQRLPMYGGGCPGITAILWHGSPHPRPRNMMSPVWPKRIDCG